MAANGNTNGSGVDGRLAAVERDQAVTNTRLNTLTENVQSLSNAVQSLTDSMATGFQRIETLVVNQRISTRPTWQTFAGVVGFIVLLGGPAMTALAWYVTVKVDFERQSRVSADRLINDRLRVHRELLQVMDPKIPDYRDVPGLGD